MNHVIVKFEMIARRIAQVVVILRCQAMQQSKRSNLIITLRALALWAVYGGRFLAKGVPLASSSFLYPIPQSQVRVHVGLN